MAKRQCRVEKNTVCIVGYARTPIGSFLGSLSSKSAVELGAIAIREAVKRSGMDANDVQEVFMGNVLSAGLGQGPARSAAKRAGIPDHVPCTLVNKVCSSGLKAVMLGAQSIMLGLQQVVVVGGMESMSNAPHYGQGIRKGKKFGSFHMVDGVQKDGLTDATQDIAMGFLADKTSQEFKFDRKQQDQYAAKSYARARAATESGRAAPEIVPVQVEKGRGSTIMVAQDEETMARVVTEDTLHALPLAFDKTNGSITAGSASTLSDGGAALVLMDLEYATAKNIPILAIIRGFGDAAQNAKDFTTAPSLAIPKALKMANLQLSDMEYHEINEAFAITVLSNAKSLQINLDNVNIHGGAISMGHPLGCSGARILVTLCNILAQEKAKYGCASICNGGGGASAMIIEHRSAL